MKTIALLVISTQAAVAWATHMPPIQCPDAAGHKRCMVATENRVVLKEDMSGNQCVKGKTWKFTDTYIEVSGACRGRFAVGIEADEASRN